jgi:phosphocarrier protein HPr
MVSQKVTIIDPIGIHARPASILVKEAKKYQSTLIMHHNGKEANLTAMLKILSLAVGPEAEVEIVADGSDEQEALDAVVKTMQDSQLI